MVSFKTGIPLHSRNIKASKYQHFLGVPWMFRSKYPCWKCILGQFGYIHLTSAEICSCITVNLESPLGGVPELSYIHPPHFPVHWSIQTGKTKSQTVPIVGRKWLYSYANFTYSSFLLSKRKKKKKKEMHISWCKTVRCVTQCLATHLPHQELKVWRNPLRQAAWWSLTDGCLSSQVRSPLL